MSEEASCTDTTQAWSNQTACMYSTRCRRIYCLRQQECSCTMAEDHNFLQLWWMEWMDTKRNQVKLGATDHPENKECARQQQQRRKSRTWSTNSKDRYLQLKRCWAILENQSAIRPTNKCQTRWCPSTWMGWRERLGSLNLSNYLLIPFYNIILYFLFYIFLNLKRTIFINYILQQNIV